MIRRLRSRRLRGPGLVLKLFGVCALVASVAVVAATWTTVQATAVAEHQERQQSLHADAIVYESLIGYSATHGSWSGAGPLVRRLATHYGHRIAVTDGTGRVLLDSAPGGARLRPAQARAVLDPLAVDSAIATAQDASASTPLDFAEPIPSVADGTTPIATASTAVDARITSGWSGRRISAARAAIRSRANSCLQRPDVRRVLELAPRTTALIRSGAQPDEVDVCLRSGVRAVLGAATAPRALLFAGGGTATAAVFWNLSGDNRLRIIGAAAAVLLIVTLLCGLLSLQIVRPLTRMAAAATRAGDGDLDIRVPASRHDELGDVARAFNHMADRRQQLEAARLQLMSDISHELRTPLANIRGWLEAAQDRLVQPDVEFIESLHEETLQLQRLVQDVHQLAMGDVGALRLEPEAILLAPFLEQVAAAFRGAAAARGVVLAIEVDPSSTVTADPFRLRQAVSNLIANSLRHTPGGTIRLSGRPGEIVVADDGEGIPPEALPEVFERFHRVDPSRTRATGGSGLGLAIVRQFVEAQGGAATIRSTVGLGTTVTLRFPADVDTGGGEVRARRWSRAAR